MPEKKIVIAGGGFAGSSAARYFGRNKARWSGEFEVILVDPKEHFEFLPMLPDVVRGRISPESLCYPHDKLCRNSGCVFLQASISGIEPSKKKIFTAHDTIQYDYLLVAAGSKTDFYGNREFERSCFKLNSLKDATDIRNELILRVNTRSEVRLLVIGGGYTGLEIASSAAGFLEKSGKKYKVTVAERSSDILGSSPGWLREKARREIQRRGIEMILGEQLASLREGNAYLASGRTIEDVMCVWTAGVRVPEFLDDIPGKKFKTRINVDGTLALLGTTSGQGIFAAGDAAAFYSADTAQPMRMAVMFAISQGVKAADNIIRDFRKRHFSFYRAHDLGYVIPLLKGSAPGIVLGVRIHPRLGYFLHYFMCVYRAPFKGKIRIIADLIRGRAGSAAKGR